MLPNSDINGFQKLVALMTGGNVPVQDPLTGITYKFDLSTLVSVITTDFRWVSTHSYDTGEIVSYSGSLWESDDDDNEGNIPATGSAHWTEVPASKGLTWWKAGVYTEDKVAVLSDHRGQPRWYILLDVARPFNSANIATEEAAGKWKSITEYTEDPLNVVGSVEMHPDFKYFKDARIVVTGSLAADFAFVFDTGGRPDRIIIFMQLGFDGIKMELPDNCVMSDSGWGLDAVNTWTSPPGASGGVFVLKAERSGANAYFVTMSGPFS